jgi:ElaB/YqjD/DUF883 family membrane-anchored ribosome-binding protein
MINTIDTVDSKKGPLGGTLKAAGDIAAAALDVELLKKRVENAVEDAVVDARRMAKRGRYAVEDMIDDTAYRMKKAPWHSAGYVFGAGLGIGALAGWFISHRSCERQR